MLRWLRNSDTTRMLDEVSALRSELKQNIGDLDTAVRRELDATSRQLIRRVDDAVMALQRQSAQLEKIVEDLRQSQEKNAEGFMERADEASRFYDKIALFIRDLASFAEGKRTRETHVLSASEKNDGSGAIDQTKN